MEFETERLILRKPEIRDARDMFENYTQDEEVTRYLTWPPHGSYETTREWLESSITNWNPQELLELVIYHKEDRAVIGMAALRINSFKATLGYVLAKKYWGRGYMAEACRPLCDYLLSMDHIYRIEGFHDVENPASGRVLQKLGMEYEGLFKRYMIHPNVSAEPRDCHIYSLIK